jgi:hypothetical protein
MFTPMMASDAARALGVSSSKIAAMGRAGKLAYETNERGVRIYMVPAGEEGVVITEEEGVVKEEGVVNEEEVVKEEVVIKEEGVEGDESALAYVRAYSSLGIYDAFGFGACMSGVHGVRPQQYEDVSDGDLNPAQYARLVARKCVFTGRPRCGAVDRVDYSRGYELGNVFPACPEAIALRGGRNLNEFRALVSFTPRP